MCISILTVIFTKYINSDYFWEMGIFNSFIEM
jgi:hypothetical protein